MGKIEISIHAKLPLIAAIGEGWKSEIQAYLNKIGVIEQVSVLDETNEIVRVNFSFEKLISVDEIIGELLNKGANIIEEFIELPASFSGVASAYDARDAGNSIVKILKLNTEVKSASVSSNGIIRIQCYTLEFDKLLSDIIKQLTERLDRFR